MRVVSSADRCCSAERCVGAAGSARVSGSASRGLRLSILMRFLFWGFLMVQKTKESEMLGRRGWCAPVRAWRGVLGDGASRGQRGPPSAAFRGRRDAPYRGGSPSYPPAGVSAEPRRCLCCLCCGRGHRGRAAMPRRRRGGVGAGSADGTHVAQGWSPTATKHLLHPLKVNGASRGYGDERSGERAWVCPG